MTLLRRILAPFALVAIVGLGLAACSPAVDAIDVSSSTTVIDVRTPDEFASGHLDGAINIDVQNASFDALVAELPTEGDYVVYCRSGNRSAAAIARMEGLGFTSLVDAGGLNEAATATELEIVR